MAAFAQRLANTWGKGRSSGPAYDPVREDEGLMGKESGPLSQQYLTLQAQHRQLKRWLTATSVLLCLALLGLSVGFWKRKAVVESQRPPTPVPVLPIVPVKFDRDDRYAAPSSPETDVAWGSISPPGDGFIFVNNSASYNLEPGKPSSEGEVYDVSLFHQLHCLTHIRTYAFTMKAGMDNNNTREVYDLLLRRQEDHVFHCFDYIRQALMCAGDMTIEWPREEADGRRFAVDGWGITHQCRSWDAIIDFMMENTVYNDRYSALRSV